MQSSAISIADMFGARHAPHFDAAPATEEPLSNAERGFLEHRGACDVLELVIGSERRAVAVQRRPDCSCTDAAARTAHAAVYNEQGQVAAVQKGSRVYWRDVRGHMRSVRVVSGTTAMVRHMDFYALDGKAAPET